MLELVSLSEWKEFFAEGDQYLRVAERSAVTRTEVFTPEILYNIIGMAIEKYLMAFLMHNGQMADNHTMLDLLHSVERITGPLPELKEKLAFIDSFQEICDMDNFNRRSPSEEEVPTLLATANFARQFVAQRVGEG